VLEETALEATEEMSLLKEELILEAAEEADEAADEAADVAEELPDDEACARPNLQISEVMLWTLVASLTEHALRTHGEAEAVMAFS